MKTILRINCYFSYHLFVLSLLLFKLHKEIYVHFQARIFVKKTRTFYIFILNFVNAVCSIALYMHDILQFSIKY